MKTINRIRFFGTKSAHIRCYGISRAITQRNETFTADEPIELPKDDAERAKYRATVESCKVINRLLQVPGVTHLRFRPFEIHVTLAAVYDWSDVHDDIVTILKEEYFGEEASTVTVEERAKGEDEE